MTEEEWMIATNSEQAILCLNGKVSDRKLRLFGVECCWLCHHIRNDDASRNRLEIIELYADGAKADADLRAAAADAWEVAADYTSVGSGSPEVGSAAWIEQMDKGSAFEAIGFLAHLPSPRLVDTIINLENFASFEYQLRPLLREIFGNPFRPVTFDPAWRTDTVLALARQMYASRDFGGMPILADALQDAGCDNPDVLNHCRGDGPHVRGCWVVDLVLGKE